MELATTLKVRALALAGAAAVCGAVAAPAADAAHVAHLHPLAVKIGRSYATVPEFDPYPLPPVKISWPACGKKDGVIAFPASSGILDDQADPAHRDLVVKNPLHLYDSTSKRSTFVGTAYASALVKPGHHATTVRCIDGDSSTGGIGKTLLKAHITVTATVGAESLPDELTTLIAGTPTVFSLSIPPCRDHHVSSAVLASAALPPGPDGKRTFALHRGADQYHKKDAAAFIGSIPGATDVAPGTYPATISCGSGVVQSGTVGLG